MDRKRFRVPPVFASAERKTGVRRAGTLRHVMRNGSGDVAVREQASPEGDPGGSGGTDPVFDHLRARPIRCKHTTASEPFMAIAQVNQSGCACLACLAPLPP